MTSEGANDSQSSYPNGQPQKPPFEVIFQLICNAQDCIAAEEAMQSLGSYMRMSEGPAFEHSLKGLTVLFRKGYTCVFMTCVDLMRKMMNYFTALSKKLETDQPGSNELLMIYLLSLIAELIRENPKFYFPFTRKFLLTVFRIDYEMLQHSQLKKDILAILSVVYENFSRQRRLVVKYKLAAQLKTSLLENFSLIEEIFTLKIFNKAICNLTAQGVLFTSQEFAKYGILETLSMFIQRNQAKLLMSKLRLDELTVSKARQDHMERIEEETGDAEDSMKEDNELSSMESK